MRVLCLITLSTHHTASARLSRRTPSRASRSAAVNVLALARSDVASQRRVETRGGVACVGELVWYRGAHRGSREVLCYTSRGGSLVRVPAPVDCRLVPTASR